MLVDCGRARAKCGLNPANFGRCRAKSSRFRANVGRVRAFGLSLGLCVCCSGCAEEMTFLELSRGPPKQSRPRASYDCKHGSKIYRCVLACRGSNLRQEPPNHNDAAFWGAPVLAMPVAVMLRRHRTLIHTICTWPITQLEVSICVCACVLSTVHWSPLPMEFACVS